MNIPTLPTALRCDLEYVLASNAHFMLHIQCASSWDQRVVQESLVTEPNLLLRHSWDPATGNRIFRCDFGPGTLRIRYDARVELYRPMATGQEHEMQVTEIPDEVVQYLLPSRYCQSDLLSADAQQLFGNVNHGYQRVAHICQWIRDNIHYQIGTSCPTTTALDVYRQRAGVCRDFAHLVITFCRALNMPARLVVGYCHFEEPPQDFHAVAEVWLAGRWVMFDPTALAPVERLVRVGKGRDAKDIAFGTIYGAMQMTHMHIQVNHDGRPPVDRPDPVEATVPQFGA